MSDGAVLFVSAHDHVLLGRRTGSGCPGVWELPHTDDEVVAAFRGELGPFGNAVLAKLNSEFEPTPNEKYDLFCWLNPGFAASCSATDPVSAEVLTRFDREQRLDRILARLDSSSPITHGDFMSEEARAEFVNAQVKAEHVAQAFGDSAPAPLDGERVTEYRRRLLGKYKQYSAPWKDKDLSRLDSSLLDIAETQIFADAQREARAPTNVPAGTLVERIETDRTGRRISKFFGDPEVCWNHFKGPVRNLIGINTGGNKLACSAVS